MIARTQCECCLGFMKVEGYKEEEMKLKMLFEPSPKCPFCRDNYGIGKHLIARRTIIGNLVYDCPECCAIYEEEKENEN